MTRNRHGFRWGLAQRVRSRAIRGQRPVAASLMERPESSKPNALSIFRYVMAPPFHEPGKAPEFRAPRKDRAVESAQVWERPALDRPSIRAKRANS